MFLMFAKKLKSIFEVFVVVLFCFLFIIGIIFEKKYSLTCDEKYCTLYVTENRFSPEPIIDRQIDRQRIQRVYVTEHMHRKRSAGSSSASRRASIHLDYRPVIVLQDGEEIRLPFKKCRSSRTANSIAQKIMNGQNFVYPKPKQDKTNKTNKTDNPIRDPLGKPSRF